MYSVGHSTTCPPLCPIYNNFDNEELMQSFTVLIQTTTIIQYNDPYNTTDINMKINFLNPSYLNGCTEKEVN